MLLHDASESIRWQVGKRGARALRWHASVRNIRAEHRAMGRASCSDRAELDPQCHGHPHCGRVAQLFHDDASLPPGAQVNHQSNSAGRAFSTCGTVSVAHCEGGVPQSD